MIYRLIHKYWVLFLISSLILIVYFKLFQPKYLINILLIFLVILVILALHFPYRPNPDMLLLMYFLFYVATVIFVFIGELHKDKFITDDVIISYIVKSRISTWSVYFRITKYNIKWIFNIYYYWYLINCFFLALPIFRPKNHAQISLMWFNWNLIMVFLILAICSDILILTIILFYVVYDRYVVFWGHFIASEVDLEMFDEYVDTGEVFFWLVYYPTLWTVYFFVSLYEYRYIVSILIGIIIFYAFILGWFFGWYASTYDVSPFLS